MRKTAIVLFFSIPALAMTDAEYQRRTIGLRNQQKETDVLMRKFGLNVGFADSNPASLSPTQNSEANQKPLFQVHSDFSTVKIPTGKLLYGKTLTRLVVGPDGSPILIVLDSGQGALSDLKLMGLARQAGTEGRLTLEFNKLLLRTGKAVGIQSTGLDTSGAYGLEAQVFSGKAVAVAGAMASSFISGFAASQQTQNTNALGFSTPQPTGRNALLQGVAQTAADQGKRLIEEATAEKPILVVESQTALTVLVQEEVRF